MRLAAGFASPTVDAPDAAASSPAAVYRAAIAGLQLRQARVLHTAVDFSGDAGTYSANQLLRNISTLRREYQRLAGGARLG